MAVSFVSISVEIDMFSAMENSLWVLVHPGLLHFFARVHCRKQEEAKCGSLVSKKKQNLLFAEKFSRCVGVFSLNTENFDKQAYPCKGYKLDFQIFLNGSCRDENSRYSFSFRWLLDLGLSLQLWFSMAL